MMLQKTLIFCVVIMGVLGCAKEKEIFNTDVGDLYVIKPDSTDPVKSRLYEIYSAYGVAAFFTDTVGTYFVKNDIHGKPVFRTEKLDLGWEFTTYKDAEFKIFQITNQTEQLAAIDYMEKYLKSISKPLYPFTILLAREMQIVSQTGEMTSYKTGEAKNYFRTLLMTDMYMLKDTADHFKRIVKSIIRVKLDAFPDELNKFGSVTKSEWYGGKKYSDLDLTVVSGTSVGLLYQPALVESMRLRGFTEAQIEAERVKLRRVCGQFGLVSGNDLSGGYFTPNNMNTDLDGFVNEILKGDKQTFQLHWGNYPLVMKKYNILHELIKNKLGVDL